MYLWRVAAFVAGGAGAYLAWLSLRGMHERGSWPIRLLVRCLVGCAATIPAVLVLTAGGAWPGEARDQILAAAFISGVVLGVVAPLVSRAGPLP
jgi:hypothetical protein